MGKVPNKEQPQRVAVSHTFVTSKTSGRPDFHGANMTPSGRLPSERDRPAGSKIDRIRAAIYLLQHGKVNGLHSWDN